MSFVPAPLTPPTLAELEQEGVRFIDLTWVDLANTVRARTIPLAHFRTLCAAPQLGISIIAAVPGFVFNTAAPGFDALAEVRYEPDFASLARVPYKPDVASVFGWFRDKDAEPGTDVDKASQICPRGVLKRILKKASETAHTEFLVGFESEFILLKQTPDGSVQAVNNHPWSSTRALLAGTVETTALREMVDALTQTGIVVEMYHAEAAPGQYEIVTGPLPPLEAADALIRTRETIVNIAAKHSLRATFAPRVYDDSCGTACHAHISLHPTPSSPAPPSPSSPAPLLSPPEQSFLAGLLAHLRALCALTLPTPQSYARVHDGVWSGGTWVSFGLHNREAPLRICGRLGARRFEFRALDGCANPYVALAGVLGVGAHAVKEGKRLEMGECRRAAAEMTGEERGRVGVTERMPRGVEEARGALERDEAVMEVLGEVGRVWRGVNETLEKSLKQEAERFGRDIMRVMIDNF